MAAGAPDPTGLTTAIDALIAAGARDEARRLLDRFGDDLVRAGFGAAVERSQSALDEASAPPTPHALLLHARALGQRNAVEAIRAFQDAYARSIADGDELAATQAACGLLRIVFVVWDDFSPVPRMLVHAERAFDGTIVHPDATQELESLAGLLAGRLLMRASSERRVELFERMVALTLDPAVHGWARLSAGGVLLAYCQLWNEDARADALVRALDPVANDPAIALEQRLIWRHEAAIFKIYSRTRNNDECRARIDELAAVLPSEGYPLSRFQLGRLRFELSLVLFDFAAAEDALAEMRRALDARLAVQAITLAHKEAILALTLGQFERGLAASSAAVAKARAAEVPPFIVNVYRQISALARGYGGDAAGAIAELEELYRTSEAGHQLIYEMSIGTVRVAGAFAAGDSNAISAEVDSLLGTIERANHPYSFSYCPPLGAKAMAHALTQGIRPEMARRVIAAMRFRPPPDLPDAWPWAVRLHLLGTPSLEVDGVAAGGSGKAQQRPLELLHLIAISGGGDERGADAQSLMYALWPEADADAKANFNVALMRLRKLLQHDGLVTLADGRVRLDRQRVWCDVWAFFARTGDAAPAGVSGPPPIDDLLSLYRGPLLGPGPAPDWAIGPREQLRSRFLRAVAAAGEAAEAAGRWQEAIAVYERGLEQDNLAEDLYRGLMRCHIALGESANALRAYRRCRDILSIVLGVKPTAETEALLKSVPGT